MVHGHGHGTGRDPSRAILTATGPGGIEYKNRTEEVKRLLTTI
jgi:hypothetical protein